MELLIGLCNVGLDVLFQRWRLRAVPDIHHVGGPMDDLTCIVTGPTSGIGRETAASLCRNRAVVVLACRNQVKGSQLKEELEQEAKQEGRAVPKLEVAQLDVASLTSIRSFASQWGQRPLHVLINNAGLFTIGGAHCRTPDGFEMHMGTNYLGAFLLSLLLLPNLQQGAQSQPRFGARLILTASKMHELVRQVDTLRPAAKAKPEGSLMAYNHSKLAQVQFAAELRRRLKPGSNVGVCACNPGEAVTGIMRGHFLERAYQLLLTPILITPTQAARCPVFCASSPLSQIGDIEAPEEAYWESNCKPAGRNHAVRDEAAGSRLWLWSAEATGLDAAHDLRRC
ncbi:hypothetical protein WJX73_003332 [Symbiochloris irregularis]|uniref:Uncharacterized protein n=1 Tax=Symbiochloris irregularis TaxID=706552 RepID=A0AAW1PZ45_9CHLO